MTLPKIAYPVLLVAAIAAAWLFYQSRQPKFGSGETAPDFQMTLADGSTAKLSDLRGKMVLLQFWGSWCGPCRAENPELVALYNEYHARGLEIVSIGIENNAARWQSAIQADGMIWPYHASSLKQFDDPIAVQFNVKQIPTVYVLNREGKIIGLNLQPAMIGKIIKEQI